MRELKKLQKEMLKSDISRRDFLTYLSALGLTTALSPCFFNTQSFAATPQKGGRLRIGSTGGAITDSLEPAKLTSTMAICIAFGQLQNALVEIDHEGQVVPELAESWDASSDAKKWVFKLRKGVEFHNGKPFEAEDVLFSINLHRGKKSKSGAKVITNQIEDIRADGKHTVVIDLKEGNADFAFLMFDFHLGIVPNNTVDFEKGIGTGPYMLESWEPGVRSLTKKNPNYWKKERAYFDEVEVIGINDPTARINALKTGEVDIIDKVDPKVARMIESVSDLQLIDAKGNMHYTMPMLTDVPPYDNNNVRLALKYAINRQAMVDKILRGFGSVGNDHPIGPGMRFFASEIPQRKYDPDKAIFYLKKSGLQNHTFSLHAADAGFPGAVDAAMLYKEHAAKAGINIEVVREPNDGYWSNVWMKKPWCMCYWTGRATEDWVLSVTYAGDAKWNDTHWKHAGFDKLLKEARVEMNETKRGEMYLDLQRILRDDGGVVIPMFASFLYGATSRLEFDAFSGLSPYDGYRGPERWWFSS